MTDNRELLNDDEVDFLLQGTETDTQDSSHGVADADQTVTMHGDLERIQLADIFQTLSMSKMQGVLRVRNPLEERQLYCEDGHVQVLAPTRATVRRLGQRLVRAGIVDQEQLRRALVQQRKERVPLGALLVRDGLVEQRALEEILELQAAEDLFALFTWQHGTFEFFRSERPRSRSAVGLQDAPEYEIHSLLLEVARRSDEWELILERIQSLDEVPQPVDAPADVSAFDDVHHAVFEAVDGQQTYRQIADQTTFGLFECARAARDLVDRGWITNLCDEDLVELAGQLAAGGESKRAVVLLQTLNDREGALAAPIVRRLAVVLEQVGEKRLASTMLLEAGQRASTADAALDLARDAVRLSPHDAAALHFLRSVLVAHEAPNGEERAQVTLDLVDELIEADMITRALEILAEEQRDSEPAAGLLVREARAHQRAGDDAAAVATLIELAERHLAEGARDQAIEAYRAALRLDGSRRDIARTLAAMRRTRAGNIVRLAAAGLSALMVGAMGFVWLEQRHHDDATRQAMKQVQSLLSDGDKAGARAALESWKGVLGSCESIEDLASRVAFAEAAETKRVERQRRARLTQRMSDAADALARGGVLAALDIYGRVHAEPGMAAEVEEIAGQRLQAVMDELAHSSKTLLEDLPPAPGELLGRADVQRHLARCTEAVSPALLRAYDEFGQALDRGAADLLPAASRAALRGALAQLTSGVEQIRALTARYRHALAQSDVERRLDPMFKDAVAREAAGDFAGALALYRVLADQHTGAAELRAHFRARVTRNATITKLMDALAAASRSGDHHGAHQQLRALRKLFPAVAFDELVQLPLRVEAQPPVAEVVVDGVPVGMAPLVLQRTPAQPTEVTVRAPGFRSRNQEFGGDGPAAWTARLELLADGERRHASAVEVPPAVLQGGDVLLVDRSGCVTRLSPELEEVRWTFRSDDLSGYLSEPVLHEDHAWVASLDGALRALRVASGEVTRELADLPTEVAPVRSGNRLIVATTDGALRAVDFASGARQVLGAPGAPVADMLVVADQLVVLRVDGELSCWTAALEPSWSRSASEQTSGVLLGFGEDLVLSDDQGRLSCFAVASGERRWRRDLGEAPHGAAAARGAVLLSFPDRIVRVRSEDGALERLRTSPGWVGPVTCSGNRLICGAADGALQVLDATTGASLYQLPGRARSKVFPISDGCVVVDPDHRVRRHGALR